MPTPPAPPAPSATEFSGQALAKRFFPGTGKSYDRVVRWTTLGLDKRWKKALLAKVPKDAKNVLELASGTGILSRMVLDHCPQARLVGVDLTDDYQQIAKGRFPDDAARVEWRLGDATKVDVSDRAPFDAVVSCYIPKYVNAVEMVDHLLPLVRPGGIVVLHDFARPHKGIQRWVWRRWFWVLDTFAPKLHPEWSNVFDHTLADLILRSEWIPEFRAAFNRPGWKDQGYQTLSFKSAALVWATRA